MIRIAGKDLLKNNGIIVVLKDNKVYALGGIFIKNKNNFYVNYYFPGLRGNLDHISIHANTEPIVHLRNADKKNIYEQKIKDFNTVDYYEPFPLRAISISFLQPPHCKGLSLSFLEKYKERTNFYIIKEDMYNEGGVGFDGVFLPMNNINSTRSNAEIMERYLGPPKGIPSYIRGTHSEFKVITVLRIQNIKMNPLQIIESSAYLKVNKKLRSGEEIILNAFPK